MSGPVIAVDGPTASGKGTLARRIAAALDFAHLDTGTLYRAVAAKLLEAGANPDDAAGWVWRGIIDSSFAGAKGGMGALGLAKSSRKALEQSVEIVRRRMSQKLDF